MKTIYIAGPMRGYPLYNFPAFNEAEADLTKQGWNVMSPASMDVAVGFDPASSPVTPEFLRGAMRRDCDAILDKADAIALLPGWDKSTGAKAELGLAIWKGIPAFLYPSMVALMEEDVLEEALRITRGDRQAQYGPPDQDFARTAKMWSAMKGVEFTSKEVALFMIALKMSRETHQKKRDNWVDIAGYARCGSLCGNSEAH